MFNVDIVTSIPKLSAVKLVILNQCYIYEVVSFKVAVTVGNYK
jgi:hypothetical protein